MAFVAVADMKRQFEVACPYERVFEILSDVPESVSHFPNIDELVDLGDGVYRWEMKKIGVDKYNIQTIYACKYVSDPEKGTVKWTPVKGEGNALVRGRWNIKALDEERTRIKLTTKGELEIPLPRLVKMLVAPIVIREFENMVDKYVANLSTTFESKPKKRRKKKK